MASEAEKLYNLIKRIRAVTAMRVNHERGYIIVHTVGAMTPAEAERWLESRFGMNRRPHTSRR